MTVEFIAVAVAILFTIATSVPLGHYMARVFTGEVTWLEAPAALSSRLWGSN